jgi:sigma-B regulation protein RsbU (phosphoserine phosphatase)
MVKRKLPSAPGNTSSLGSQAERRSLLEASLDALVIIGPDAKIADLNTALETVTGLSRAELLGRDASSYFSDPEQARQLYRDVRHHGAVRDRPLELRHRDGHLTRVLCSASAYKNEAGALLGVVAAARPVAAFAAERTRVGFDPRLRRAAARLAGSASALACALGLVGLVAWAADLTGLRSLLPDPPEAFPLQALCFGAEGLAAWLASAGAKRGGWLRVGRLLASAVAGAALLALGAAIFEGAAHGYQVAAAALGIELTDAITFDGWSALAFLALSLGVLAMDWTLSSAAHRYWPAHGFAFTSGMIAIAALVDAVVAPMAPLTRVSVPSAIGFILLTVSLICSRVEYGLGELMTSTSLGGTLTRWLWPAAVIVPALLGTVVRKADTAGLLPREGDLSLLILSMIMLLGLMIIWNGARVDRSDRLRQNVQDALSRREQELLESHRLAKIGSWRWDLDEDRVTWSPELFRITSQEPTEPPPGFDELPRYLTTESAERFRAALEAARAAGTPFELEVSVQRTDGVPRYLAARGEADRNADGRIVLLRGTLEDITERKLAQAELNRLHRAQHASSRCNQALVRARDEPTLLQQICDIIVENTDYRSSWVGRAEHDAQKSVRIVAIGGQSEGYSNQTFTWAEGAMDPGSAGECIRTGNAVLIGDIAQDPRTESWRAAALARGYASLLVLPLWVNGSIFGVLGIYATEPRAFGEKEVALLRELADDLAFGLTTLHTRDAHARAEEEVRLLNAELEQRVQSRTAELSAANRLKDELLVRQEATSAELNRAREREADVGFKIQQTLLLDSPPLDVAGLGVAAHTLPSQRVDGDFYAFVNHQNQVLDVIVGDVMGKGILAALLGAATKSHFLRALGDLASTSAGRPLPRPKDIVMLAHAGVARHLIELESFVTLCYARLDMLARRLEFVDCGHTGIILLRERTGEVLSLHGQNLPLGVREGEPYEQFSVPLDPGDTLLLFSDGITEARDAQGNGFGVERLEQCVKEHARLGPGELIAAVSRAVRSFSGNARPSDDQTSVAIHVETTLLPVVHAELELRSDLTELGRARDFVRTFCRGVPGRLLDDDAIAALELATNEATSNIMKHAYSGDPDQLIRIDADAFENRVSVRLRHLGSPFTPGQVPAPAFNGSRESGFGAYIIESSVDEVKYYRDANGMNCVALFKTPATHPETPKEAKSWT